MSHDYASPLLGLPAAVPGTGVDAGVAWHYGDPIGEQRATERGPVLIDQSHRAVLTVTGEDRLTWLHTLTSQFLQGAEDGTATEALLLSPNGHVEHHIGVSVVGRTVYLDTEPSKATQLRAFLERMVFWSKVDIGDAGLAQLRLVGTGAAALVAGADRAVDTGDGGFARPERQGVSLFVPPAKLAATATRLIAAGARPAGSWAAEALRVADRTPRIGLDTDERTIPNELGWLTTAVHLDKGCYRGQETVARVHNLGRPPRRLVLLQLDGSADRLPEPGDELLSDAGRVIGRVGTAAHHYEQGPIALALVKSTVAAGTTVVAGGVDAMIDPADEATPTGPPQSAVDRRAFTDIRRR